MSELEKPSCNFLILSAVESIAFTSKTSFTHHVAPHGSYSFLALTAASCMPYILSVKTIESGFDPVAQLKQLQLKPLNFQ